MAEIPFDDDPETYEAILEEAKRRGITPAEVVKLAIEAMSGRDSTPDS